MISRNDWPAIVTWGAAREKWIWETRQHLWQPTSETTRDMRQASSRCRTEVLAEITLDRHLWVVTSLLGLVNLLLSPSEQCYSKVVIMSCKITWALGDEPWIKSNWDILGCQNPVKSHSVLKCIEISFPISLSFNDTKLDHFALCHLCKLQVEKNHVNPSNWFIQIQNYHRAKSSQANYHRVNFSCHTQAWVLNSAAKTAFKESIAFSDYPGNDHYKSL